MEKAEEGQNGRHQHPLLIEGKTLEKEDCPYERSPKGGGREGKKEEIRRKVNHITQDRRGGTGPFCMKKGLKGLRCQSIMGKKGEQHGRDRLDSAGGRGKDMKKGKTVIRCTPGNSKSIGVDDSMRFWGKTASRPVEKGERGKGGPDSSKGVWGGRVKKKGGGVGEY